MAKRDYYEVLGVNKSANKDEIKKANEVARRKLIHIPLREGRTIHHDVKASHGKKRLL